MPEATSTARAAILDRIRKANAAATEKPDADYTAIARKYQQSGGLDRKAMLEIFAERLREYDARLWQATAATLPNAIGAVFSERGEREVMLADGIPQSWLPDGLNWRMEADTDVEALNNAEGAIVACEVAIAHTGSIVVRNARRLTLLPDRLLCIVREEQVVETVPEAFARLQPFAADALTFISGPSATADIEMTRIRGVHGPRSLDVVLL
jgi:L-lactate dehydrogenase complex protein LldG